MSRDITRGDETKNVVPTPPVEKGSWLGVSVSPAPVALRRQLKLPDGTGLVVDFVQPGSPAEEAGIKQYDLLEKLEDQLLINPEQFAVLIHIHKPGQGIALTVIRDGERKTMNATLAEHDVPKLPDSPWPMGPNDLPIKFQDFRPGTHAMERSLTLLLPKSQVTVTTRNGHSNMVVMDLASGRELFNGPVDTPEQRKALTPQLRRLLELVPQWNVKAQNHDAATQPQNHQAPSDDPTSR